MSITRVAVFLVAAAEKATGKKVSTAIVLHPNPDKFNGTAALQARGIDVITSRQVRELIPAVHQIRLPSGRSVMASTPLRMRPSVRAIAIGPSSCRMGVPSG